MPKTLHRSCYSGKKGKMNSRQERGTSEKKEIRREHEGNDSRVLQPSPLRMAHAGEPLKSRQIEGGRTEQNNTLPYN
jgi:hypothetical protein